MRRFVIGLAVGVALTATGFQVAAANHWFVDVPSDHPFVREIDWLQQWGITQGCNPPANDRFCPDQPVTRGELAAFLHRLVEAQPTPELVYDLLGS